MAEQGQLQNGPLTESCVHLCVDMQNLFAAGMAWHTPWIERVLPVVERIAAAWPERTIFTRFIPAERRGEGKGTWRRYYERWSAMTLEALPPGSVDLLPSLARLVPPAEVIEGGLLALDEAGARRAAACAGSGHPGHHRHGDRRLRPGSGAWCRGPGLPRRARDGRDLQLV